jgi:hypothetical protein
LCERGACWTVDEDTRKRKAQLGFPGCGLAPTGGAGRDGRNGQRPFFLVSMPPFSGGEVSHEPDGKTASRLANVLAMLSSPNDGERANAALMATRMLKELGLDW